MVTRFEAGTVALWGIALAATLLVAGTDALIPLGVVFFVCMVVALVAIQAAPAHHVEWVTLVAWAAATIAVLASTVNSMTRNVLGPIYFVCMIGSIVTARTAYKTYHHTT